MGSTVPKNAKSNFSAFTHFTKGVVLVCVINQLTIILNKTFDKSKHTIHYMLYYE